MNVFQKIIISIPSLTSFIAMAIHWFPKELNWINPTYKIYRIEMGVAAGLMWLQIIILIRLLWSIKGIEKRIRNDWTGLLIIFTPITSLIFVWRRYDEIKEKSVQGTMPNSR